MRSIAAKTIVRRLGTVLVLSEWAFQPAFGGSFSDAFVTKLIQIDE
jgi:hypothetical protein